METKNPFESNSFKTNDHEAEQIFRETCSWYKSKLSKSGQSHNQAYQKYTNNYHKIKSLYFIAWKNLIVYDTESEREEVKILKNPIGLSSSAYITLLPNGELFYICSYQDKAFIIDSNYEARLLPSGLRLYNSSAIYFKANVYCFGGADIFWNRNTLSRNFDLNKNIWINLTPMPKGDYYCHSVVYNENILICGYSSDLLLYSVDIDLFSIIPYNFVDCRKILINADRLYLIECFGSIYESEIENENAWNKISDSLIMDLRPSQVYCLYNKGKIYISVKHYNEFFGERYFKFDLRQKIMTKF